MKNRISDTPYRERLLNGIEYMAKIANNGREPKLYNIKYWEKQSIHTLELIYYKFKSIK